MMGLVVVPAFYLTLDRRYSQWLAGGRRDRFGLRPAQLSVARRPPAGLLGAIEVLSAM